MTKRITILLIIMLCCLLGLLSMQGYLTYQEFQRQQKDFARQVNELFAKAVEAEKVARVEHLVSLFLADLENPELIRIEAGPDPDKARTIFHFFEGSSGEQAMSISFDKMDLQTDTMTPEVRRQFLDRMEETVRKDFYEESIVYWTKLLGERLLKNIKEVPIDTQVLRSTFQSQLDSLKISSSFTVVMDTTFASTADQDMARTVRTAPHQLFGESWVGNQQAMAIIDNPGYTVFQRSLFTIGGSASVILLTLLSFYLLFSTILRQKKLSEMKDDFIDNITHELQTPITTLRLAIDSLRQFEVKEKKERFANYLRVSGTELNRLAELVDGILMHSTVLEPGTLDKVSIDLMPLLREAADRHRLKAAKPVTIQLPDWDTFEIVSSRFHLDTIVDNLLQNAIRYSGEDGVHIDVLLERKTAGFVLKIADNGWGIAPEDRQQVFEKFYRSSAKDRNYTVKGMGIGLYHVRQCVEALGGTILVRNNQPKGTVMEVRLEQ